MTLEKKPLVVRTVVEGNPPWIRPWTRGLLAIIAVASIPTMLMIDIKIPNEWWLVVSAIVGFYFASAD
ncbi:hypothetical protein LCGC14_2147860 [marine sediment metagenome]|uniref:Uncharacterized protein n=1 Tax=marine sediment metagenome TaxID=412755 RepID=A0A0F9GSN7_9ZZZZ